LLQNLLSTLVLAALVLTGCLGDALPVLSVTYKKCWQERDIFVYGGDSQPSVLSDAVLSLWKELCEAHERQE
jgi:hypothetical protein